MKKNNYIPGLIFIITYVSIKIIYKLTGFKYTFSDGLNMKFLIDLALWITVFIIVTVVVNKFFSPNKNR